MARVEDDSNLDGRINRWEHFDGGILIRLEVDMSGTGHADRRLVYRKDGSIERIEVDPSGSGVWQEAPLSPSPRPR